MKGKIPYINVEQTLVLKPDLARKLAYYMDKYSVSRHPLMDTAIEEYLIPAFQDLNIQYFGLAEKQAEQERDNQLKKEREAKKDHKRLVELAKKRLIDGEVEVIKKEEKKAGKKFEAPKNNKHVYGI